MRIFKTFAEAKSEIARDMKEMGLDVESFRMQDKSGNFPTLELINYGYTILQPNTLDLRPTQPWANNEWAERQAGIEGYPCVLGEAWGTRGDMDWGQYLEYDGLPIPRGMTLDQLREARPQAGDDPIRFAYTYAERFALNDQVIRVIRELRKNPHSRQLYIAMWDPAVDIERIGHRRVPCSLGWHFMMRSGKLHMTYTMRSCDFLTHWQNDCWLALQLMHYVAAKTQQQPGQFCHFINSFHVYKDQVADVF